MTIRVALVALLLAGTATASGVQEQTVKLRIEGSDLRDGVPERISFVFVNLSSRALKIPPLSPCTSHYYGHLTLMRNFSPVGPQTSGHGGGCGGGGFDGPSLLEQVKTWKIIFPHDSLTVTYKRSELFDNEQAAGTYEFWGKYDPPPLTAEEIRMLDKAAISFPREVLTSERLRYTRPE